MWLVFDALLVGAGYVASIYTWDKAKSLFQSADTQVTSLEAKITAIKAKL